MLKALRQHVVPEHQSNHIRDNSPNNNCSLSSHSNSSEMGNVHSRGDAGSCSSGIQSSKGDILTTVTSQEELHEYVRTQSMLEMAQTPEEVSEAALSSEAGTESHDSTASRFSRRRSSHRVSLKGVRQKGHKMVDKIGNALQAAGNAVGHKLNSVEDYMFPHTPQFGAGSAHRRPSTLTVIPKVRGGVLLRGCVTDDEHKKMTREVVNRLRSLKGEEGLKTIGLEYRIVPTDYDQKDDAAAGESQVPELTEELKIEEGEYEHGHETVSPERSPTPEVAEAEAEAEHLDPNKMMTRLFHKESNTMITMKNRKKFIADGDMYDAVARVCQEYAQEVMIREGNLEWVTICEAGNNPEPIRALVSTALSHDESNLDKLPTLLIATGKGKVRAGVFSRHHLLMSGMECSTAVPVVREAQKRGLNVVMLDPNVHGDRLGMITFEKSMAKIFGRWEKDETSSPDQPPLAQRDLYVLSHSQSGAQFARYLLEKSQHYVPHIRAVAFTDSTHNIQWAKEKKDLHQMLESDTCVYFKCSKENSDDDLAPLESVGKEIDTDSFWEHRFGRISTRCAGTSEHSLTNWFVRSQIWEHFDQYLRKHSSPED